MTHLAQGSRLGSCRGAGTLARLGQGLANAEAKAIRARVIAATRLWSSRGAGAAPSAWLSPRGGLGLLSRPSSSCTVGSPPMGTTRLLCTRRASSRCRLRALGQGAGPVGPGGGEGEAEATARGPLGGREGLGGGSPPSRAFERLPEAMRPEERALEAQGGPRGEGPGGQHSGGEAPRGVALAGHGCRQVPMGVPAVGARPGGQAGQLLHGPATARAARGLVCQATPAQGACTQPAFGRTGWEGMCVCVCATWPCPQEGAAICPGMP